MNARRRMVLAAAGSLALLAGAYMFEGLGYAPCKMCLWQRWPHFAAVGLGLVALVRPSRLVAVLGAAALLTTVGLGAFHSGVERGWWRGPASCSGGSDLGGLSGADLLSTDVADHVVMCDQVAWSFAGLSMASWNAVLSLLLALVWASALVRGRR